MPLKYWALCKLSGNFLSDRRRKAHIIMSGVYRRLVVPGSIRKQTKLAKWCKKLVSSTASWPLNQLFIQVPTLLDFLPRLQLMMNSNMEA